MPPIPSLIIAVALAATANVAAAPAPTQSPAATASPAASPAADAPAAPTFDASDLDNLRANVGKEVVVTGTPTGSGHSKSGTVLYLNFAGAHKGVALVFFVGGGAAGAGADPGAKKATSEEDIKPFVGKAVSVKGKLADYKGDLQIVINSLDQITVAPAP